MIQSIQDILLVVDMDGTLLTDDKELLNCNVEALKLFKQLGGHIVVATGRVFDSVKQYPALIELIEYGIVSGGVIIYDYQQNTPIKMASLPGAAAHNALRELQRDFPFVGSMVGGNDLKLYQVVGNEYTQILFDDEQVDYYLRPQEDLPDEWNKVLFAGPADLMPQLHDYAGTDSVQRKYPGITFVATDECYYELLPQGISKGSALKELSGLLDIPLENTVVIGDYYNDIEMMAIAGRSIAMADAPPEVQNVADEITLSCNDGGVGHAVYGLIREYG